MNNQKVLTLKERLAQIKQGRKNRAMNSPRLKKLASRKAKEKKYKDYLIM